MDLNEKLLALWLRQKQYNSALRGNNPDFEFWMKQYVLGLQSEASEVLDSINWKLHRKGKPVNRTNLGRELADLLKYVVCMFELYGFSAEQAIDLATEKSEELEAAFKQDFKVVQPGSRVVICDLDGTLADYRTSFVQWLQTQPGVTLKPDNSQHLYMMEVDLGLGFLRYNAYKEQFEAEGGYADLLPYSETQNFIKRISTLSKAQVLIYTARPQQKFSHIWLDTWRWLTQQGLQDNIFALHVEPAESRIARAATLREQGCQVVLVDDDPTTALRAANAGVAVLLRNQPYNHGISHPNIRRTDKLSSLDVETLLAQEKQNG